MNKLSSILKSPDFWIITTSWISETLSQIVSQGYSNELILTRVFYWLSSVLAIGKLNSALQGYNTTKFGAKSANNNSYTL